MEKTNSFKALSKINVNNHVEKKNGLSYLSWAFAVSELMLLDPKANWAFHDPIKFGDTMMVSCTVTAFDKPMTMHLPVMDYKNKAIANPDAFAINTAMMRCLVKCIAVHGLGLYIYAGEDLPEDSAQDRSTRPPTRTPTAESKPAQTLPFYSDEAFKKNYPAWQKKVEAGGLDAKTIMARIESRFKLTPKQKTVIESLGAAHANV